MKRIVSCACIMILAVFLTVFLSVLACTKAEAASSVEEARQKMLQEDRKKELELPPQAKEAGFIAFSKKTMNYADAVAFCKSHGGKLPRINNSGTWDGKNPPLPGILIDGFGYGTRPWKEIGLPHDRYWTDTVLTGGNPDNSWFVGRHLDKVIVTLGSGSGSYLVVCVP